MLGPDLRVARLGAAASALLAVLLAPIGALAQSVSLGERTPAEGLVLPPASAATVDDAASGTINPAGLGLMRDLQLEYFHSRETLGPGLVGDGLYGGWTIENVLALGLSVEWLRPGGSAAYDKTHLTVALAPDRDLSLGFAYNIFGSSDPALGKLTSMDLGLTWRPWTFVSVAASVRDLDNPALGTSGISIPRRYDLGLAVQPFGAGLTLAGDYLFLGEQNTTTLSGVPQGPGNGQVGLTGQLAVAGMGLSIGAGLPVGASGATARNAFLEVALRFDIDEHVALLASYAPADLRSSVAGLGLLDVGARFSKESFSDLPSVSARS